jgi:SAM-dependent methyltransferase
MEQLKNYFKKQQFNPGFLGIFINPFYFVRRELYKEISFFSKNISGKMLDVGCGVKPYQKLFNNVKEYVGMEFDSQGNREKSKSDIFYDGKVFPFKDSEFDSIIFTQVLEHVFNPDEFLSEVNRVLKKNGKILLTIPFVWDEHSQPYDYARYSSFGLKSLLEKHDFKILESHKTLSDIRVIFQLINCYLYKIITVKNYKVRLSLYVILFSPFTIIGMILSWILPRNTDLYMDNVVLAQK